MLIKTTTDSRFCESVSKALADSARDTTFTVSVAYEPPAPVQLAGIYESLAVYLNPETFKAAMIAAGAIVGSEVVKDAYKWVKSLFKRNCEAYVKDEQKQLKQKETRGIDFRIREEQPDENQDHSWVEIQYIAPESSEFDEHFFDAAMAHYESVVLPVIAFWSQHAPLTWIIIEGRIDAIVRRYSWTVAMHFDDRPTIVVSICDPTSTFP